MITGARAYRSQLGVFAKYWEPGKVKTRLAKSVGMGRAAIIYRMLLKLTLEQFANIADQSVLCYSPPDTRTEFEDMLKEIDKNEDNSTDLYGNTKQLSEEIDWQLEPQSEGNLGERMKSYFDKALAKQQGPEPNRVALMGSDSPTLPPQFINDAFTWLDETDVVLGPTEDGGYYLVATKVQTPPIFDNIDWSTPQVLEQTIKQLESNKINYKLLPQWFDIDEEKDLNRMFGIPDDFENGFGK